MTIGMKERIRASLRQVSSAVTVRPIRHSDAGLIDEMHRQLSPESIYARYLQDRTPSLAAIAEVCAIGPEEGAGFVATVQQQDESVVGVAYYLRDRQEPEATAEPAVLVVDHFQGQGIGRRLWQLLHRHAQANRIRHLHVYSDPSNQRLLRLLHGSGYAYQSKTDALVRESVVTLDDSTNQAQVNQQDSSVADHESAAELARLDRQWRIQQKWLRMEWMPMP